jgi:hypothetical protein
MAIDDRRYPVGEFFRILFYSIEEEKLRFAFKKQSILISSLFETKVIFSFEHLLYHFNSFRFYFRLRAE